MRKQRRRKNLCKAMKVQGRLLTWENPKLVTQLGQSHLCTWQQEISATGKTLGLSVLSSSHHLRHFAPPKILVFSILESRNYSRRRSILIGYTREIQQIVLWWHFDTSRHCFPSFGWYPCYCASIIFKTCPVVKNLATNWNISLYDKLGVSPHKMIHGPSKP